MQEVTASPAAAEEMKRWFLLVLQLSHLQRAVVLNWCSLSWASWCLQNVSTLFKKPFCSPSVLQRTRGARLILVRIQSVTASARPAWRSPSASASWWMLVLTCLPRSRRFLEEGEQTVLAALKNFKTSICVCVCLYLLLVGNRLKPGWRKWIRWRRWLWRWTQSQRTAGPSTQLPHTQRVIMMSHGTTALAHGTCIICTWRFPRSCRLQLAGQLDAQEQHLFCTSMFLHDNTQSFC